MFLVKLRQSITSLGLEVGSDRLLLAISGGPDSVALGHGMWKLGFSLHLAHMNYQLRGEDSEREEQLVRDYAEQWDQTCSILRTEPKTYATKQGISLQVACRDLRYAFFEEVRRTQDLAHCLTAHHTDDQVETLLMGLIHGNHPEVLRGIPGRRGAYLRPMLQITKAEIMTYLEEQGLEYGWDVSNDGNEYRRNRIRNQLLPLLEELQPNIRPHLLYQHQQLQQQQSLVEQILSPFLPETRSNQLAWQDFLDQIGEAHLPLLLTSFLQERGIHGHLRDACLELIPAQPGKWVQTPQGKVIRLRNGVEIRQEEAEREPISMELKSGQQLVRWAGETWEFEYPFEGERDWHLTDTHYLDVDQLRLPLQLRSWQQGDRMQPLGMKTNKKLSDIFVDKKYDPSAKQQAWVLEDQQLIVCLSGFRIAETVKITAQTRRILRIRKLPSPS